MHRWFTHRIHISWHIAWLSLGVLGGVAISVLVPATLFAWSVWLVLVVTLFLVAGLLRWRWLVVVSLTAGVLMGVWRGSYERQGLMFYQPLYGKTVMVKGTVDEDASLGAQGDMRIELAHIQIGSQLFRGRVWVSLARAGPIKRGDTVYVSGTLGGGFGGISASMYRAVLRRVEHPVPGDIARQVRDWFADGIHRAIPEPQAALGIGYLTGQHATLPQSLNDQLRAVGLTHAVVASGYNLTILVSLGRSLLASISKYMATVAAGLLVIGFMLVAGASPSMMRAGLVSGLSLTAWYYGRVISPFVLLSFAAAVTVLLNPSYIWGDVGWYLSFAAFAGVLIVGPVLERYFWAEDERPGALWALIVETMSAELLTTPIILLAFGQYAAYALPANLLVLPLVPAAMLFTFFAGVGGLAAPPIAHWIGWPADGLLHYMIWVVARIADLPAAQREVHITIWEVAGYYVVLAAGLAWLHHRTKRPIAVEKS